MTTTPIAAGPNDVTVRARFEQWYLRGLRGNPSNLELDENGEYKYLPTLFLAFDAGEKNERNECAGVAFRHSRAHEQASEKAGNDLDRDMAVNMSLAADAVGQAIIARSNAELTGDALARRPG